jgi:hypothetical protein
VTPTQLQRRTLNFRSLDEAVTDAERLHQSGYDKVGNWDLAQVCFHLSEWMRFPLDGYPKTPLVIAPIMWLMRKTAGRKILEKTLTKGFEPGGHTLNQTLPAPGGDEAAAVARLRQTVERFGKHNGPYHPSPLFGQMTRDEWTRLNLAHCAHHLSFLIPKPLAAE